MCFMRNVLLSCVPTAGDYEFLSSFQHRITPHLRQNRKSNIFPCVYVCGRGGGGQAVFFVFGLGETRLEQFVCLCCSSWRSMLMAVARCDHNAPRTEKRYVTRRRGNVSLTTGCHGCSSSTKPLIQVPIGALIQAFTGALAGVRWRSSIC